MTKIGLAWPLKRVGELIGRQRQQGGKMMNDAQEKAKKLSCVLKHPI